MKRTILVLALVLTACGGPGVMTEPQCEASGAVTCDGERLTPGANVRWNGYCTDGGAVTIRIVEGAGTFDLDVECDGECQPMSHRCAEGASLCPEGQVPLCVWPSNFCEVYPEAADCT